MIVPSSISELESWLKDNCYPDSYAIGSIQIFEGFGLKKEQDQYVWYFTERGQHQNIQTFSDEKSAVNFAFKQISSDRYANRHLLVMTNVNVDIKRITSELNNRKILFETDEIPYGGLSDFRTRIFVFGCDIKKAKDLVP